MHSGSIRGPLKKVQLHLKSGRMPGTLELTESWPDPRTERAEGVGELAGSCQLGARPSGRLDSRFRRAFEPSTLP